MRRSNALWPALGVWVLGSWACSPGPGRPPVFPDAQPDAGFDGGVQDVGLPDADAGADAGPSDVTIVLPDGGPPPSVPFSGVYVLNGQTESLFAREVGEQLSLIVGGHPYVYTGSIDSNGNVDVRSDVLERSGCVLAQITGIYERATGFFILQHKSCSPQGAPFDVELRGQLVLSTDDDYDNGLSGIYELEATIAMNFQCFLGGAGPFQIPYAINVLPGRRTLFVFTAGDVLESPDNYIGTMSPSTLEVATSLQHQVQPSNFDVQMSGRLEQFGPTDPPKFTATQDVWDHDRMCGFTLLLEGVRTSLY